VSSALALAAEQAGTHAGTFDSAHQVAGIIAQMGPTDYAGRANPSLDAIVAQARIGGSGVDKYALDRWGNVLSVADPRNTNWKITYAYNAANQVTDEYRPKDNGQQAHLQTVHDKMGRVVSTIDARGFGNVRH